MKFPVLSHTLLNDWDNCQHKAYRKYIVKDLPREGQTEAMKWGNEVHSAFEKRLKGEVKWPIGMEKYEAIAAPLARIGAQAEKALGIDAYGSPVDFWGSTVWLRGKVDATVANSTVAAIFDWKTGKRREERAELATHAVLFRAHYPEINRVVGQYVWLQDNQVGKAHDVSDTESKLAEIRSVANVIRNQMATGFFPKRQNGLCGWCPVKDCEFNRTGK